MAWELLPENYTDAVWEGLKKYTEVQNGDGTISFLDVTAYSNKEKSFFGAKDANRMNEALNIIMSMVESGTDLYTAFQNYFALQKSLFEGKANETQSGFNDYVDNLKAEGDKEIETIKTDYRNEIDTFEEYQESLFLTWFAFIKGQLGTDVAGNLQNQIFELDSKITETSESTISEHNADVESHLDIRSEMSRINGEVETLKLKFLTNITANQFTVTFETTDGIALDGVYNTARGTIDF